MWLTAGWLAAGWLAARLAGLAGPGLRERAPERVTPGFWALQSTIPPSLQANRLQASKTASPPDSYQDLGTARNLQEAAQPGGPRGAGVYIYIYIYIYIFKILGGYVPIHVLHIVGYACG